LVASAFLILMTFFFITSLTFMSLWDYLIKRLNFLQIKVITVSSKNQISKTQAKGK